VKTTGSSSRARRPAAEALGITADAGPVRRRGPCGGSRIVGGRGIIAVALIFGWGLGGPGCAHQPQPKLVSTAAAKTPGPIALGFDGAPPVLLVTPMPQTKVHASAVGALSGAGLVLQGAAGGGGYALIGAAVLAPVAAVGGGVYGAVAGVAERDLNNANLTLTAAQGILNYQESLADAMLAAAKSAPGGSVALSYTPAQTPMPATDDLGTGEKSGPAAPASASATAASAQLRLRFRQCKLAGAPGVNPPLHLLILIEGNLIRATDGMAAGTVYVRYVSKPRKYTGWGNAHVQALHEEWAAAASQLATQIVSWLSGTVPPPLPVM
jgi:hypothetical protein